MRTDRPTVELSVIGEDGIIIRIGGAVSVLRGNIVRIKSEITGVLDAITQGKYRFIGRNMVVVILDDRSILNGRLIGDSIILKSLSRFIESNLGEPY